jgi:hypothetical protein
LYVYNPFFGSVQGYFFPGDMKRRDPSPSGLTRIVLGGIMPSSMSAERPTMNPHANSLKKQRGQRMGVPVPAISLRKAIELMNKVWEKEKRNPAPVSAIMHHWGYGAKSSGGFQAVASLKKFGLLLELGSKDRRALQLSPLALDILKSSNIDLKEYTKLIQQAALEPKAHQELWEKWGAVLPSDQTFEAFLVFEKSFSEEAAKDFIGVYKDTIGFAKLKAGDTVGETKGESNETLEEPKDTPQEIPENSSNTQRTIPPKMDPKYLTLPTDAGDAAIPMGMSLRDFQLFKQALDLFRRKIIGEIVFPVGAIWRNNDSDKPLIIVKEMGEKDGVRFFESLDGTGIPETELKFI